MADKKEKAELNAELKALKKELADITQNSLKTIKDLQSSYIKSIQKLTSSQALLQQSIIKSIEDSVQQTTKTISKSKPRKVSSVETSDIDSQYRKYLEEEAANQQQVLETVADSQVKYSRTLYERLQQQYAAKEKELNDVFAEEERYYSDTAKAERVARETATQSVINSLVSETKSREQQARELEDYQNEYTRLLNDRQKAEELHASQEKEIQDKKVAKVIQNMVDETKARTDHIASVNQYAKEYEQLLIEQERIQREYNEAAKRLMEDERRERDLFVQSEINKMIDKTKEQARKEKELAERAEYTTKLYDEQSRKLREEQLKKEGLRLVEQENFAKKKKDADDALASQVREAQEKQANAAKRQLDVEAAVADEKYKREALQMVEQENFAKKKKDADDALWEQVRQAQERQAENAKKRADVEAAFATGIEQSTNKIIESLNAFNNAASLVALDAVGKVLAKVQELNMFFLNIVNDIRKIQQELGTNAGIAIDVKVGNVLESIKSFFSTGALVNQQQVQQTRIDFQSEFGGILTGGAAGAIAQRSVEEGITPAQQAAARRVFMTQTLGDVGPAVAEESKFISEFENANLTAKDAMEAIGKYSELLARNGIRFSQSFTKAAADAKKIGVDLGKVDQIGDNIIDNFEGFLESQAELGAMGFNFDSFRLAQIAETGDTGALFNELRSQLSGMGKDITNLRRSEQLAISDFSDALGSSSELQRLSGKTAGSGEKTMDDIQKENNGFLSGLFNFAEKGFTASALIIGGLVSVVGMFITANGLLAAITANTGGFGAIVSLLPLITSTLSSIASVLLPLAGIIAGAIGLFKTLPGAYNAGKDKDVGGSLMNIAGSTASGAAIGAGIGAFFGGGVGAVPGALIGGGIGLVAGAGTAAIGAMQADDMVSKAGYGERTLVTPTATVALNNDDKVVAYADDMIASEAGITKYAKGDLAPTPQINNQVDLSKLEAKLDQLVRTMASMNVYIDSTKVGKILTNNNDAGTKVGVLGLQQTTAL